MNSRLLPLLFVLSACNAAPDRKLEPPRKKIDPTVSYVLPEVYAGCLAADDACGPEVASACCDGLFCSIELFVYGPGTCIQPQIDGSYCNADGQCLSGHCVGAACRSGACADQGSACDDAFPCCQGFVCDFVGYTEGICVPPYENGHYCLDDGQCQSGRCYQNVCADPSCREQGAECYDDQTSCCPGLLCFQDPGAYGVALCGPPMPAGSFCLENAACASNSCVDNVCQ